MSNTTYEDHIARMVKEKADLQTKLQKLDEFIRGDKFYSLNKFQKYLLSEQKEVMQKYLDILTTRITSDTFVMNNSSSNATKVEDAIESSEHN